jgi:hypothetical protein
MMEAVTLSEKLGRNYILAQLMAWEDFIAFRRRESFKSCIYPVSFMTLLFYTPPATDSRVTVNDRQTATRILQS